MNDDAMKPNVLSAASLEEMPEISEPRFRRRPRRGHHASRNVGEIVAIDAEFCVAPVPCVSPEDVASVNRAR